MGHILFHEGPGFDLKIKIFTSRYILEVYINVRHKEVRCKIYKRWVQRYPNWAISCSTKEQDSIKRWKFIDWDLYWGFEVGDWKVTPDGPYPAPGVDRRADTDTPEWQRFKKREKYFETVFWEDGAELTPFVFQLLLAIYPIHQIKVAHFILGSGAHLQ